MAVGAMKKVGVVGAGTMGFGIAIVAARGGFVTVVHDADPERLERIKSDAAAFFGKSVKIGKLSQEAADACLARLVTAADIGALADCDLVIEAVFESFAVKRDLLKRLGEVCGPDTVLASNTSTLSITQLAATCGRPEKFVGLHFCLPAQIMKLVEVTPGLETSEATLAAAWQFCESAGQIPIKTRDTPGFILNYFVIPLNNAAIRLVEQGVASAKDIDLAVKAGLGHAMGPLELLDMVGLDTQILLCEAFYETTRDPRMVAPHLLRQMVAAGRLGRKSGRGFYDYSSSQGISEAAPAAVNQPFRVVSAGESRSFPGGDPFLAGATTAAETVVITGFDAGAAFAKVAAEKPGLILVELDTECLGEVTGERAGEEGGNVLGFSRFRLGGGSPSQLVELVTQPRTPERVVKAAVELFEGAGFKTAVCADRPGRIVDRLVRPYLNAALERLDDGLASAGDIDRAVKLGLGFKRGPIEWLEETGLADHCEVSDALSDILNDPSFRPARRARIAANRKPRL